MDSNTNGAAVNAAEPPRDSGPGPLDVIEARATLHTRHALDEAEGAVARLAGFLERSPRPEPRAVAREARDVADRIEYALGQVSAIRQLGIGDER